MVGSIERRFAAQKRADKIADACEAAFTAAFPGVVHVVRGTRAYPGSEHARVSWLDGPAAVEVAEALHGCGMVRLIRQVSAHTIGTVAIRRWLDADTSFILAAEVSSLVAVEDDTTQRIARGVLTAAGLNNDPTLGGIYEVAQTEMRDLLAAAETAAAQYGPAVLAALGLDATASGRPGFFD